MLKDGMRRRMRREHPRIPYVEWENSAENEVWRLNWHTDSRVRRSFTLGGLLAVVALASPLEGAFAHETAEVFAPGVVSAAGSNFAPTFSPSSSFVLFSRKSKDGISVLLSERNGAGWSA